MEVVLGVLSAVLSCSTLLGWMLYRTANRRIKNAEADKANAEANAAEWKLYEDRLTAVHKSIDVLNEQLEAQIKLVAHKEEVIEDKTQKIRKLQDEIYKLQNERLKDAYTIGEIRHEKEFYKSWHCQREYGHGANECTRRLPPQKVPMKYIAYQTRIEQEQLKEE